ncbi:MAG: DUF1887 family protein [Paludibacteraceae bacterium]|nr:DUF1887 family protein [Paludibacteraceae bacterium]
MKTHLVSLISDNLIPNYLIIKEFEGQYDDNIFITTKKMKEKGGGINLESALGLQPNSVMRIYANEESWSQTLQTLNNSQLNQDDRYIVNYTGGTKPMSIAVSIFFSKINGSRFIYSPIGTNTYRENGIAEAQDIKTRITLENYFLLYGITIKSKTPAIDHKPKQLYRFFDLFHRNDRSLLGTIESARQNPDKHPIEERTFLCGGWFEEYIYARIKEEFNLSDDEVARSVQVYKKGSNISNNDNEIDVAFVYENKLYIIECKSSISGPILSNGGRIDQKEFITSKLYKLAAISTNFGLVVNSYLFVAKNITVHNYSREMLEHRKRLLKIKQILDGNKFASRNTLKSMMM